MSRVINYSVIQSTDFGIYGRGWREETKKYLKKAIELGTFIFTHERTHKTNVPNRCPHVYKVPYKTLDFTTCVWTLDTSTSSCHQAYSSSLVFVAIYIEDPGRLLLQKVLKKRLLDIRIKRKVIWIIQVTRKWYLKWLKVTWSLKKTRPNWNWSEVNRG